MNSDIVKISISGLPAIFPTGYTDKLNTYLRIIANGTHSETVVTDKAYCTIYDRNFQERTVQNVTYDKYILRIMANEHLRAERIQFAKFGYVTTQDEVTHKMKVLSVNYIKQENTELGTYEIEYADVNPKNYKNQQLPINNYLEQTQIQKEYTTDQLVGLTFAITDFATIPRTFYTELVPDDDVAEPEEENQKINGVEKVTRSVATKLMKARFYLNTEDKNIVARFLPWADVVTLTFSSGTYTALERILPEINPVGVGLFQIDVFLKYEISNYYPENII